MVIQAIHLEATRQGFYRGSSYPSYSSDDSCRDCCIGDCIGPTCCIIPTNCGGGKDPKGCAAACIIITMMGTLFSSLFVLAKSIKSATEAAAHCGNGELLRSQGKNFDQAVLNNAQWVNNKMLYNRSIASIGELGMAFGLAMATAALAYYLIYYRNPKVEIASLEKAKMWAIRGGATFLGSIVLVTINLIYWRAIETKFHLKCNGLWMPPASNDQAYNLPPPSYAASAPYFE